MEPVLTGPMMALHDDLVQSLFVHQVALLDRDFARAAATLQLFRAQLLAHVDDEERHVLPHYERLGGDATDAPTRLFRGEHKNLHTFVDEFVRRVDALRERSDDAALLELFDRQATFKNLLLHHDLRERNMLYPFLAARLSPDVQAAILQARSWSGG